MKRLLGSCALAGATLWAASSLAQPCIEPLAFSQTGDDPSNPTFTDAEPQFPVWIMDMGVNLNCSLYIQCYADAPGGTDPTDFDGWLRRLLNSFAVLDQHTFNAVEGTWLDLMRDYWTGFRIIQAKQDCTDKAWATTASAEHRVALHSQFHDRGSVPQRAAILAHEVRHTHGVGGFDHTSGCINQSNCDPSWEWMGAHRFYVHFSRQFADDFTQWPQSVRALQLKRANDYLTRYFEEPPPFNLAIDETTSYTVPFTWNPVFAEGTCELTEDELPFPAAPREQYALRGAVVGYAGQMIPLPGGGWEHYARIPQVGCPYHEPETDTSHFHSSGRGGEIVPLVSADDPPSYLTGLVLDWEKAPLPANPTRFFGTAVVKTRLPDGELVDPKAISYNDPVDPPNADAYAFAEALHVVQSYSISTSASTGRFDLVSFRTRLPWPFTEFAGTRGGTAFPQIKSSDGACPDDYVARSVLFAPTSNGKYLAFFGLLCGPRSDVEGGYETDPSEVVLVHSRLAGPGGTTLVSAGVSTGSEVVSVVATVALETNGNLEGVECPDEYALSSIAVDADQSVQRLRAIGCRNTNGNWVSVWHETESSGAEFHPLTCTSGRAADGLYIRSEDWIDGISVRCGEQWH